MSVNLPDELIARFRDGDATAFKLLFDMLSRRMLYVAQSVVKDAEVADEVLSDSFLRLWERRDQFDSLDSIRAFLYVVVRNACLNHVQSARQRVLHVPVEEDTVIGEPDVIANILRAELYDAIHQELCHLTPKQAAVFRLSVLEGKGTEEVCQELGITPGSVFTHRSEAIKHLRKALCEKRDWVLVIFFSFFS